eukprot:g3550.t1
MAVILFIMMVKNMEYLIISTDYATYYYIILGMLSKLKTFFSIFFVLLAAFATFNFMFSHNSYSSDTSFIRSLLVLYMGSDGDFDFAQALDGPDYAIATSVMFVFSIMMALLMMNLMIAVMGEAIEDVKTVAKARRGVFLS